MAASNREKRRLLGFIASRGGRVTSGYNDSLLRWTFEILARESYVHERIDKLEEVFEALEADGDLVLERDERGKLIAAHLADDADYRHADFESSMFESPEELWALVVTLLSINGRLRRQIDESDIEAAIELAADAESRAHAMSEQLRSAQEAIAGLTSQATSGRQQADVEAELAALRLELATSRSRQEGLTAAHTLQVERWRREKADLRNKLSKAGNEMADQRRRLETANYTIDASIGVITTLRSVLKDHGVIMKVVESPGS